MFKSFPRIAKLPGEQLNLQRQKRILKPLGKPWLGWGKVLPEAATHPRLSGVLKLWIAGGQRMSLRPFKTAGWIWTPEIPAALQQGMKWINNLPSRGRGVGGCYTCLFGPWLRVWQGEWGETPLGIPNHKLTLGIRIHPIYGVSQIILCAGTHSTQASENSHRESSKDNTAHHHQINQYVSTSTETTQKTRPTKL